MCHQAGLRAGLQYSVTVERPQSRLGPKKGRSKAPQAPQMYQLEDADVGFNSVEVLPCSSPHARCYPGWRTTALCCGGAPL